MPLEPPAPPLALFGGRKTLDAPSPHFSWPPALPELGDVFAKYLAAGEPLSIVDRGGIYGRLEDRLCELHDRRYALLVSSGTMALYSAFFGLGIERGDEVISTVYSFHATASPLLHLGARITFCDVERDTGNIAVDDLARLIGPKTRAVVTNDMWGHPVDKAAIGALCKQHGVAWVEDCSHAHFARYEDRVVGSFADAAVLSLQGNKLLTGGEGGVLLCDDQEIYRRATLLGHGLARSARASADSEYAPLGRVGYGLKLRMHPLAAVMVDHLLEHYCFDWIAEREATLRRFTRGLSETGLVQPMARRPYVTSMGAHYGFKPRLDFAGLGVSRERLVEALRAEGLDVSIPGSLPFHRLPLFAADAFPINRFEKADPHERSYPGAESYVSSILSLPTFTFEREWPLVDAYVAGFARVLDNLSALR